MARTIRSAIIAILLFATCGARAASLQAYLDNITGLKHFKDKLYFQSYQDFLRALENDPLNPDLQMNMGLTFAQGEEWEKAEKAFQSAYELSKGDKEREFMALFNLGVARGQKGDIDGALKAYQAALDIEPESIEVKTNIELLWQNSQGQGQGQGDKGGKGNDKDKDKDQDQGDKDKDKNKNQDKNYEQPKKQPKPFQSKDLSKEDVRKILDEIGNQEQSIRAKEYDKGAKERNNDKDW